MKMLAAGAVLVVAVEILIAYVAIRSGAIPANADARPSKIEAWIARSSLHAALRRGAPKGDNPVPPSGDNLLAGMKLYVANCAVCHGAADGAATNVAHGMYQRPPQLASDGVEDDPAGVTYWKIYHGIRFTAMPSFASTLSEKEIWQLTAFLANMDRLPAGVDSQWKRARVTEAIAPAALQSQLRAGGP
jgi:thiosulfate dehydrogenase